MYRHKSGGDDRGDGGNGVMVDSEDAKYAEDADEKEYAHELYM
jgi:hypothetical protein